MGYLDKEYNTKSTLVPYSPKNEQEAWIAIMHSCIAVDDDVADEELELLTQTLVCKSLFSDHDIKEYYKTVLLMQAQLGSKHLIDNSVDKVAVENRPTLFALTMELVLADGILAEKEIEIIAYLSSALDLDAELANKIVAVVMILNNGNLVT